MSNFIHLEDRELVAFVYSEIAGKEIRNNISDYSDVEKWMKTVLLLPKPVALTYRVILFANQVLNGGIVQYFDNCYGIFSYDTLRDLKILKADLFYRLLKESLIVINYKNLSELDFIDFVVKRRYNSSIDKIQVQLEKIEDEYFDIEYNEILITKVAKYIRANLELIG